MKKALISIIVLCLSLAGLSAVPINKVVILLSEQSDATTLLREASIFRTKQEQRAYVIERLQQQANNAQRNVMEFLEGLQHQGLVDDIESYWLVNGISCMADPSVISLMEQRRDVMTVYRVEEAPWIFEDGITPASSVDEREIAQNLLQIGRAHV